MTTTSIGQVEQQTCALCIVGAGIGGLNALFAAAQYLKPTDTVILVDVKPRAGGMWTETYDYVRLHQPHPMFTVGDIPWTLNKPPSYLANKQEIVAHLEHCLNLLRKRVNLIEYYGHDYLQHQEVPSGKGWQVEVEFKSVGAQAKPLRVLAQRLVKAFGYQIEKNDPLPFTSTQITSMSPHESGLFGPQQPSQASSPIYVVGGGKTGMDTVHALLTRFPGRKVHLIVGKGTVFWNRNKSFPEKWWGRWTKPLGINLYLDIALRFDGHNEREVFDYFKSNYTIGLGPHFQGYVLGGLSEEENDFIRQGVAEVIEDYVEDVIDVDGRPAMRMRSGAIKPVEPGSVFVNCTGYLMRREQEYEPYLSEHGCVVSIQPKSGTNFLPSMGGYLLVHLLYLGKLDKIPLYEIDFVGLRRQNPVLVSMAFTVQWLLNISLIAQATPPRVLMNNGLDTDRWFPLPRRALALISFAINSRRYNRHFRKALDAVQARTGLHCGVLPRVAAQGQVAAEAPVKRAA
jgi:hypothetical protein